MKKLLVITPIKHIDGLTSFFKSFINTIYLQDPGVKEVKKRALKVDAIFTNPNKSKVYLGKEIIDACKNLKYICTASTGTNHIDLEYASIKKIKILSLTKEIKVIKKISSTADLALTLTLMSVRNVYPSFKSVLKKQWNYEHFIGRQINSLNIGVIGYGRLGKIYSRYMLSLGCNVYVYDPYVKVKNRKIIQINKLNNLINKCDVLSIHVHVNSQTINLINQKLLSFAKKNIIIINTSRGEVVNEVDMCNFLKNNNKSKFYTDVLNNEIKNKFNSPIYKLASLKNNNQIFITPHIGGMTREAQKIAYFHAAKLLKRELKNK